MAGSSGNWFKSTAGVKGVKMRVFVSNATIAAAYNGDVAAGKRYLAANPQSFTLIQLARQSPQPGGQAQAGGARRAATASELAPNVTVSAVDMYGHEVDRAEQQRMYQQLGQLLSMDHLATDRDIADLVGAIDGASIQIRQIHRSATSPWKNTFRINIRHPLYSSIRTIQKTDSVTEIHNDLFTVKPDAPPGVATRVLARQVSGARKIGIPRIVTSAAGDAKSATFNGYYTWARLGFTNVKPFTAAFRKHLPKALRDSTDMNDLFSRPGGAEWWKAKGSYFDAVMYTSEDSSTSKALQDYLDVKGIDPYAPFP